MTVEELNQKYTEATWLIAKRSASAAGKALLFSSESLESTVEEIVVIYGLSDEEVERLQPKGDDGAVASLQKLANGLLGQETSPNANQAMGVARTAIQNGQAFKMLATLVKAGPKAAQTAASGGAVASRGTPWGWIATAGYAAGTAGWFAYNARRFNLDAFNLVREREGLQPVAESAEAVADMPADTAAETITLEIKLPTTSAIAAQVNRLTSKAGSMIRPLTLFGPR